MSPETRKSCDSGAAAPSAASTSVMSAAAGRLAVAKTVFSVPLQPSGTSRSSQGESAATADSSRAVSLVQRRICSSLPVIFSAMAKSAGSSLSSSTESTFASGRGLRKPPLAGAYLSMSFMASVSRA